MPGIFANRVKEFEPSVSHSELDFASITALSSAMQARRISASELLEHTIARIETLERDHQKPLVCATKPRADRPLCWRRPTFR